MIGLVSILVLALLPPIPGKMTPELVEILNNTPTNEKIFVIVHMNTEYPYDQIANMTPQEKCDVFEMVAMNSQTEVVNYLNSLPKDRAEVVQQFWIFNGFHLKATKDVIRELARRDDIWFVCHNGVIQLDARAGEEVVPLVPEWNITKIMAESCWAAGFNGVGIIIGHIDTGVEVSHPALTGKWLSPYWHDGVNGQSTPYDDHSHGTHTMGTICGGDGPGPFNDDVGVAYGAKFIPTKAFNSSGSGQYAWIDACMQYLANLKQSGVDIRVIGNSWGGSGTDQHFWNAVLNWKNLGIFPVFSNGNSGPGSGTVGAPASYPLSCGVGATDNGDNIASFSSRGPAPNQSPWNDPQYWYYSTWNLLKPDVSAPGVNVRSSVPGGSYGTMSGTSMASPHVTGGTAVLLQKNSNLTVTELYDLFRNYCDQPSQGAPYPNNNYGWGRINLWHSLQAVPTANRPNVVLSRTNIVNDNNGNGKLDPGENAGIVTYVKNTGGVAATNVQGLLRTTSPYITITDSTYTYGTLAPNDSANNASDPYDVNVHASTPPGHMANFQLVLTAAETTWTRTFSYQVGIAPGEIIWGPKSLPNFPTSQFIYGVAYDGIGDRIYVLDFYSNSIRYYSSDSFVTYYGALTGPADSVTDITYSRIGNALYVCAFNPKTVWKINKSTGAIIRQFNNPANDYPVGLAYQAPNTMWFADRRSTLGGVQLIYIGDTLGTATQYNSPVQGYYNTRCLAYDSLGNSFVNVQTWFNSGGTALDSVGVVEMQGPPPALTGKRFLLNPGWNIRGIEADPRDGNYWITIVQISGSYVNQIVKVKGFYTPLTPVEESEKENVAQYKLLKVVPNPAKNVLSFHINPDNLKHNYLSIYDISGRLVAKVQFNKGERLIQWNPRKDALLADGIYFVSLEKDDGVITQKFILTR